MFPLCLTAIRNIEKRLQVNSSFVFFFGLFAAMYIVDVSQGKHFKCGDVFRGKMSNIRTRIKHLRNRHDIYILCQHRHAKLSRTKKKKNQ